MLQLRPVTYIETKPEARKLCKLLLDQPRVAFDTETTGVNPDVQSIVDHGRIVLMSFAWNNGSAVAHVSVLNELAKFIEDDTPRKILANFRFDKHICANHGLKLNGLYMDICDADWLVDENPRQFSLAAIQQRWLGFSEGKNIREVFGIKKKDGIHFDEIMKTQASTALKYARDDAEDTLAASEIIERELRKIDWRDGLSLWEYYIKHERPFGEVLWSMERRGILYNTLKAVRISKQLDKEMLTAKTICFKFAGKEFKLTSGKEIVKLLFIEKKLVPMAFTSKSRLCNTCLKTLNKKTAFTCKDHPGSATSRMPKTDVASLKKVKGAGKLALALASYSALKKTKTTYIDGLADKLNRGVLHTSFQARLVTGRLSCVAKGTLIEAIRDCSKNPKGIPIEEIKPGDYVYCYDKNRDLVLRQVTWSGQTGTREVIRIHWQGSGHQHKGFLDVTPEHPVRLTTGEYVRADSLIKNQRVLAISRGQTGDGYERLYAFKAQSIRDNRFICEQLYGPDADRHAHHKNGNKRDNRVENLDWMLARDHTSLHGKEIQSRPGAHERNRNIALKNWAEGKFKIKKGKEHPFWKEIPRFTLLRMLAQCRGKSTLLRDHFGFDYECISRKFKLASISFTQVRLRYGNDDQYISRARFEEARWQTWPEKIKVLKKSYQSINKLGEIYQLDPNPAPRKNHEILHIERIKKIVPVYDLTVDGEHNFIANEICVHNSSRPNLQNIPSRKDTHGLRSLFIARDGKVLICLDYNQLELRILAHYSKDPKLLHAYKNDIDVHALTAIDAYNLPCTAAECKTKYPKERDAGKEANFLLGYGGGARILSEKANISFRKAQQVLESHRITFATMYRWVHKTKLECQHRGYGRTLIGRYRRLPLINSIDDYLRGEAERQGVNAWIQGSAADIIKRAMTNIENCPDCQELGIEILLQVHDELLVEVPKENAEEALELIKHHMEQPFTTMLRVPLIADGGIGSSWKEAKAA